MKAFQPHFCSTALMMSRIGATELEIAAALECSLTDLKLWQARFEQFAEALRVGGEQANERVKRALFSRAVGYDYDTIRHDKVKVGGIDEIVETAYVAHVPPDVGAIKYWLDNKAGGEFSSKVVQQTQKLDKDGNPVDDEPMMADLSIFSDELLEKIGQELEASTNTKPNS